MLQPAAFTSRATIHDSPITIHALKQRADLLVQRLPQIYPAAHCELVFANPLQLLVATILSAQCTDVQVNKITPALFAAFPDASAYATAPLETLENLVKSTGFFRNKAKNIQLAARALLEKHHGEIPRTLAELITLPGVGRKTANVVLGNAFHLDEGIVVDTHVARLSQRLRLTRHVQPEKIEQDLIGLIPRGDWTVFSHWLIWHGRRRCYARNPDCAACELQDICPSAFRVKPKPSAAREMPPDRNLTAKTPRSQEEEIEGAS